MKVTMLENVTPQEYGLTGDYGWADSIQWRKGASYYMDESLALQMIDNKDALEFESDAITQILNRAADAGNQKEIAGVL